MHKDILLFVQSLVQAGIPAAAHKSEGCEQEVACYYRTNPDGSVRWVWPVDSTEAGFLRFYHIAGWRPQLFAWVVRLLTRLRLAALLASGRFSWYTSTVNGMVIRGHANRWAWFSGTVGPDRKAILWIQGADAVKGKFIKIALTQRAAYHLNTEADQLQHFRQKSFCKVYMPAVHFANGCCTLEDIGEGTGRTNRFNHLPSVAVREWLQTGLHQMCAGSAPFYSNATVRIAAIAKYNDRRITASWHSRLQQLQSSIPVNFLLPLTTAHGDFTPWNVLVKEDNLLLVDWEQSRSQMPFLFDLFHFVYQSNILIGNRGYRAIRAELEALQEQPEWRCLAGYNETTWAVLERCYLLYIVTYYLQVYHQQRNWHKQVEWLLHTWQEALDWHLAAAGTIAARQLVLHNLQNCLSQYRYALLKWKYTTLDTLPVHSDVDICIAATDARGLINELKKMPLVAAIRLQRKSYMQQVELVLTDGSFLHLDLLHAFRRKHQLFMNAERLLQQVRPNEYGLLIPAPEDDFVYTWMFFWLNNSSIPAHYQQLFEGKGMKAGVAITQMLQQVYLLPVRSYTDVFMFNARWQKEVQLLLHHWFNGSFFSQLLNRVYYLWDTLRYVSPRKGFMVTFSGVDGAGKSTVIEQAREMVEKRLRRRVVVLRHRPSVLPILSAIKYGRARAEQLAAATLPRQGSNFNSVTSLLRFAWYFADYLVGQWYVQCRYVYTGYVVLYDRYYFDFMNDSRRSNIQLPAAFTSWFYRFLLKPRLNFFLYADAAHILSRKQELDAATIQQLTGNYLSLFRRLTRANTRASYIPLENIELDKTMYQVFDHIQHVIHEKSY